MHTHLIQLTKIILILATHTHACAHTQKLTHARAHTRTLSLTLQHKLFMSLKIYWPYSWCNKQENKTL